MSLENKLRALASVTAARVAWRPTFFSLSRAYDRRVVVELIESGKITRVHDTLLDQLRELCASRAPALGLSGDDLDAVVREHLGGVKIEEYGTWVHYPWSGSLVHVLPAAEYHEVRTSRNAYKILPSEQRRLRSFVIGIVGLSVGQSSAITLALEGVGGKLRIADFDTLSLSNMNRLRAAVQDVGTPKYVIAAREAFEIDPYLQIEVFPHGIRDEDVDQFLVGKGDERLDLVIEECDDLLVKVLVRERAKAHRIPLLMETSDRGMLDIERYDLEPDRPTFHGLLGGVTSADLKALPPQARVPLVLRIVGQGGLSGRAAASLLEVRESLSSWPQLASSVALGGALSTDAARRILLGQLTTSGRFFTDLEVTVRDGGAADLTSARELDRALVREGRITQSLPKPVRADRIVTARDVRRIVAHGVLAPSRGNAQPWRFVARLPLLHRPARVRCYAAGEPSFLDVERSLTHIAIGAAVENMELAARAGGIRVEARPFPDPRDEALVCELHLVVDGVAHDHRLAAHITTRATSRKPARRESLPETSKYALTAVAAQAGAKLRWITEEPALNELGAIQGAVERIEHLTPPAHAQIFRELRFTQQEAEEGLDGLDVTAIDLPPGEVFKLWLLRSPSAVETLAAASAGKGLTRTAGMVFRATSAAALLTMPGVGSRSYFDGGRALQRIWLTADSLGLSIHPLSDITSLFARVERGGGEGLHPRDIEEIGVLRRRYQALFEVPRSEAEIMILRVHRGGPPSVRSLRKHLGSVLFFEDTQGKRVPPGARR